MRPIGNEPCVRARAAGNVKVTAHGALISLVPFQTTAVFNGVGVLNSVAQFQTAGTKEASDLSTEETSDFSTEA